MRPHLDPLREVDGDGNNLVQSDPTLTRREMLRWGVVGSAALALPATLFGCGGDLSVTRPPAPTPTASFLSAEELAIVRAATGRIIPTDDLPGAIEADAAAYIQRLLSNVPDESAPGTIFAGGPFSDRNPFPDSATGTPSNRFPKNNFTTFIPLTRLQLMSWRVQLLGSAAVPGADFNDAVLGPVIGLRDRYRDGIAQIQSKSLERFGADFTTLTPEQQDTVLAAVPAAFRDLLTNHTLEGTFCAPEYGGNKDSIGWQLVKYDGDSQPLGYSIFDETAMTYRERPDKPNSTADPDEDFSGVDEITQQFLRLLVRVVGGPHFP